VVSDRLAGARRSGRSGIARGRADRRDPLLGRNAPLTFTIASEERQFRQIARLNHRAFAEEIPQHPVQRDGTLTDRYHDENTYIVCLDDDRVIGMVAVRSTRPFSLDAKLENLDAYLPRGRSLCEIRLLTVDRDRRHGVILRGLLARLTQYAKARGYELGVISATVRQLALYERLGFVPFGPLVGTPEASFQPMYVLTTTFEERLRPFLRPRTPEAPVRSPINLLPGPVRVSPVVQAALSGSAVSHRSAAFTATLGRTKRLLAHLVQCRRVDILQGSGTLANDVIAAQLSLDAGSGLVVSSGEFGERLVDHATRFKLDFSVLRLPWGASLDRATLAAALDARRGIVWLWAAHCETSTGVLHELPMLTDVCASRGVRLCLDCVSSIGTVPVDLRGVHFASGVSGKGLRALPGLSIVFYNHDLPRSSGLLPRYLDLRLYTEREGVPFTCSSNLVDALHAAVGHLVTKPPFDEVVALSAWLRSELRAMGFRLVAAEAHASPAVVTIALPPEIRSTDVGSSLDQAGFLLSYRSEYLERANWIQICLFGECDRSDLVGLLAELGTTTAGSGGAPREPG
jgi:aspartate aminotransferase-like enzyme/GNAT superfamily N-acetyltransferase